MTEAPKPQQNKRPHRHPQKEISIGGVAKWGVPLAIVLAGISRVSPAAAGAAYALIFVGIAVWQPRVALMVAFALVPVGQKLPLHLPIRVDAADLSMAILLPIALLKSSRKGKRLQFGPSFWPTLLYLACSLISTIPHLSPIGVSSFFQMVNYAVFAVLICASFPGGTDDLLFALKGTVGAVAIFAFLGIVTHFHYPADNKNYYGAFLGSGFVVAFELWLAAKESRNQREAKWFLIALLIIAPALLLVVSRGGWMEAAIGSTIVLAMRRRFALALRVGAVLLPLVFILWFTLPHSKQVYAFNLSSHNFDVKTRYWTIDETWALFKQHPLLGVGIQLRKEINAVNIATVTLAETGIQGLAAFLLLQAVVLMTAWRLHKRLDPRDPRFSLVALGGSLMICRLAHGLVDIYWCRGPLLWAFGAVGMMAAVYFEVRQKPPLRRAINDQRPMIKDQNMGTDPLKNDQPSTNNDTT